VNLVDFQTAALETAIYPGRGEATGLAYAALGLTGEAGEVANKVKKILRDDSGALTDEKAEQIASELGDVLWYAAAVAEEIDYDLAEIAAGVVRKLRDRKERGVLTGSGDKR
jgi:NTP pyrophosphatase (non-canonical NTP hydrolase)